MPTTYQPATAAGQVRLLISDVGQGGEWLFTDEEISAFLSLGRSRVLLAAAVALETIASDAVLVLKVISSQDLQTDGAKVSDALLKRAAVLRKQDADDQAIVIAAGDLDFAVVYPTPPCGPELAHTGWPW